MWTGEKRREEKRRKICLTKNQHFRADKNAPFAKFPHRDYKWTLFSWLFNISLNNTWIIWKDLKKEEAAATTAGKPPSKEELNQGSKQTLPDFILAVMYELLLLGFGDGTSASLQGPKERELFLL
jgi:hypothetical protein